MIFNTLEFQQEDILIVDPQYILPSRKNSLESLDPLFPIFLEDFQNKINTFTYSIGFEPSLLTEILPGLEVKGITIPTLDSDDEVEEEDFYWEVFKGYRFVDSSPIGQCKSTSGMISIISLKNVTIGTRERWIQKLSLHSEPCILENFTGEVHTKNSWQDDSFAIYCMSNVGPNFYIDSGASDRAMQKYMNLKKELLEFSSTI